MDESSDPYRDYMINDNSEAQQMHQSLRRKIKYYFMNPCEKFHARGRKPWKLCLQILKIVIITIQLVSFGLSNQMVVTFKEENLQSFKQLFLKDFGKGSMDPYAVYRQADTYDNIYYIIEQYHLLHNTTVGNQEFEKNGTQYTPLELCQVYYRNGTIYPGNETFEIDAEVQQDCYNIYPKNNSLPHFELYFKRMLSVDIKFVLKAINLQTVRHRELPDCYDFTVLITFDNSAHSGQIKIDLDTDVEIKECRDWKVTGATARNMTLTVLFDCLIIITCIMSFSLCLRSVLTGIRLLRAYDQHCKSFTQREVPWSDKQEFVNGWYILIIVSDILTTTGSILKIEIQTKILTSYDVCSIFLGTGTMFVWIGVVRYLGYFRKYNILILTLRAALPNVIRFICCAGIIYISYCFCGWIVLGPYHGKFRTLNTVSECLFSLINGDDMFPTFKDMSRKSSLIWIFSRVYLYSFVSLFIYMVLSLFITIITDTYDTIKQQQNGAPTTDLQKFLAECNDLPNSGAYRLEEDNNCLLNCCMHPRLRLRNPHEALVSEA